MRSEAIQLLYRGPGLRRLALAVTITEKEESVAEKDLHYYEPAKGHGLRHDPFNAIIAPRPIGWISSRDGKGNINLAPYSFFNGFCYKPPIIGFSSTSWKDSVANTEETGVLVWNLATKDLAGQATAAHVAHGVSEFKIAGLIAVAGKLVNVSGVRGSGRGRSSEPEGKMSRYQCDRFRFKQRATS